MTTLMLLSCFLLLSVHSSVYYPKGIRLKTPFSVGSGQILNSGDFRYPPLKSSVRIALSIKLFGFDSVCQQKYILL